MKISLPVIAAGSLLIGTGCGVNKGDGITGAFVMGFEALPDEVTSTRDLWFLHDGRLVTRGASGNKEVWNADWSLSHTFEADQLAAGKERMVVLHQGELFSTVDGTDFQALVAPTQTGLLKQIMADADGRVVLASIDGRAAGMSGTAGNVYTSDDDGASWQPLLTDLTDQSLGGTSANQWADEITLRAVEGWYSVWVRALPAGASTLWRGTPESWNILPNTGAGYPSFVMPMGVNAAGELIGHLDVAVAFDGPQHVTTPDLVIGSAELWDAPFDEWEHVHFGYANTLTGNGAAGMGVIGPDGHLWGPGAIYAPGGEWSGPLMRSTQPFDRSGDMSDELLQGPGCRKLYTYEPDWGSNGNEDDVEVRNGTDEQVFVTQMNNSGPNFGRETVLAPDETVTLTYNDRAWYIALDSKGFCRGYWLNERTRRITLQ